MGEKGADEELGEKARGRVRVGGGGGWKEGGGAANGGGEGGGWRGMKNRWTNK